MPNHLVQLHLLKGYTVTAKGIVSPRLETFDFRVRTISRREMWCWEAEHEGAADKELWLLDQAVVTHPETFQGAPWQWGEAPAGIVEQLLARILQLSGFSAEPDPGIIQRTKEYLEGEAAQFDLVILSAFPAYTLEQLLDLDVELYHRLVGLAYQKLQLVQQPAHVPTANLPQHQPVKGQPQATRDTQTHHGAQRKDETQTYSFFT